MREKGFPGGRSHDWHEKLHEAIGIPIFEATWRNEIWSEFNAKESKCASSIKFGGLKPRNSTVKGLSFEDLGFLGVSDRKIPLH